MTEKKDHYPPVSVRLSKEERERLDAEAGSLSVSSYIRHRLFEAPTPRRAYRRPVQDEQALGQLLAELGRSRLSANLNQLAKAAHSGGLPVTPEVHQAILDASRDIRAMSDLLVQGLGLAEGKK